MVTLLVNFWSKLYSKSFTSDCTIEGPQIGAPFKVPSYLVHLLVVPSIRFRTLVSNAFDAPSLSSVAGGCSLALLSRWGDAPLLRSVTGDAPSVCSVTRGMLPCFAQLLGGRSLASLSRFPFNGSIKLLQNLHSRGPTKQHFYVWEPRCGYLHKVKRANRAINMHSKGSNESLPKY